MSRHRAGLPQCDGSLLLTDGGLETTLVFHHGIDLPAFASCHLLRDEPGTAVLRAYYDRYAALAHAHGVGLLLESVGWRASANWGPTLGLDAAGIERVNRAAIDLIAEVRAAWDDRVSPIVLSACVGPEADAYNPERRLAPAAAERYHAAQVATIAATEADMVSALTITYAEEAIGIVRAARAAGLPVVISFTTETDGRLPSGQPLGEAVDQVDAEADGGPDYYMLNCVHPDHVAPALEAGAGWVGRVRGLRTNASRLSHAELDESTELDAGDPLELGVLHRRLAELLPELAVVGGCCGTDHRHVAAMWSALGSPA
jgi:S-methylmethionine-dependent homocysteine/selenocysteine methylase